MIDLHGNTTHHIGHANPELIAALKAQLDELTFPPRRYTNARATALAELLVAQWPAGRAWRLGVAQTDLLSFLGASEF